jgi:hypothetical protein
MTEVPTGKCYTCKNTTPQLCRFCPTYFCNQECYKSGFGKHLTELSLNLKYKHYKCNGDCGQQLNQFYTVSNINKHRFCPVCFKKENTKGTVRLLQKMDDLSQYSKRNINMVCGTLCALFVAIMSGVDAEKAMLVIDSLEETPFLTIEA